MTETLHRDDTETPQGGPQPAIASEEARGAFVRLAIAVVAAFVIAARYGVLKTVLVVVAFLAMIMLHEFGHFITAKKGGMKVTEFFVGFGPRLWSVRKGETEYGVKALPVGGYVKIIGMHNLDQIEDPADEPRTYRQQPFPQRFAVAVAGSTMHFIIAIVLFMIINVAIGIPTGTTQIGEISNNSPAAAAGFQLEDEIVSIDGTPIAEWEQVLEYVSPRIGEPITIGVERDGTPVALTVTPVDARTLDPSEEERGLIGVRALIVQETKGLAGVPLAFKQFVGGDFMEDPDQVAPGLLENIEALVHVFSPSGLASYWRNVTGDARPGTADEGTRFLSPVGFTRVASQAADNGWLDVMRLLIMINIFVGLFNMLPLLPLDGGHVVIAVYELVRSKLQGGRRYFADVAKLIPLTYAVMMMLIFLGVSALYLDIARPLNMN